MEKILIISTIIKNLLKIIIIPKIKTAPKIVIAINTITLSIIPIQVIVLGLKGIIHNKTEMDLWK